MCIYFTRSVSPICFLLLIVVLPGKLTVVVEFCYNSASSFLKLHGLVFRFLDFCFSYWLYYFINFPSLLVSYFVIICSFNSQFVIIRNLYRHYLSLLIFYFKNRLQMRLFSEACYTIPFSLEKSKMLNNPCDVSIQCFIDTVLYSTVRYGTVRYY